MKSRLVPAVNKMLRRFGYVIRKKDLTDADAVPTSNENEVAAVENIIRDFAASDTNGSGKRNFKEWRNYLNNRRIGFFEVLMELCLESGVTFDDKKVADVGSGTGYLLRIVNQQANPKTVVGYDTFDEARILANLICPEGEFFGDSLYEIQPMYDVVFCTEVIEHLVDPVAAVTTLFERIEPGGWLVLTVPDGRVDQTDAGKIRDDGTAYWGHVNFWSPESWELFLKKSLSNAVKIQCGRFAGKHLYAVISA